MSKAQFIKKRTMLTIQTHNAVSIPAGGFSSESSYHDSDGFTDMEITILNDNNDTTNTVVVLWSNDGINIYGSEVVINSGSATWSSSRAGSTATKSRYFKLIITNGDSTTAHTMSAWAYLKG